MRAELFSSETSLKRVMVDNLESDDSSLVAAAKRLKIMISDKDAHSADVLYHKHCYNKFTWDYKPAKSNREAKDSLEKATAEKRFSTLLKTQVINQKPSFLLQDLLIEINDMYEKYGCEVEITKAKDLKKLITETFPEEIRFTPTLGLHGSPLVLHAGDVNPTDYALASLVGTGLRDAEITVTFAQMINQKIKVRETKMEFPVSLDILIEKLDTYNPVKEILNVISYSVDPRWKENVEGYACPDSESRALKIWYFLLMLGKG